MQSLTSKSALIVGTLSLLVLGLAQGSVLAVDQVGRAGHEPGWTHGVIRVGDERDQIKSLPMTERPYRPLHFYGNTVRRMHYRGTAVPAPRDLIYAGAATITRK